MRSAHEWECGTRSLPVSRPHFAVRAVLPCEGNGGGVIIFHGPFWPIIELLCGVGLLGRGVLRVLWFGEWFDMLKEEEEAQS